VDDFESLLTDLILVELKGANILFNLHRDAKLLLYVKMQNELNFESDQLME